MTTAQLKEWGRFYAKLALVAAWKGVTCWAYVVTGAAGAQGAQLVDLRGISLQGWAWTLAGTVVASIATALFRFQLPDPTPPVS